jgi:DNA integrity scanning protein DisA with diadenylate cyclase activity
MTNSQPTTKILSQTDLTFFIKAVQTYYFFKQKTDESISLEIQELLQNGQDLVYSLFQDYLKKERFEIAYLQDINEVLKDIFSVTQEDSHRNVLSILPNQIGEIELQELVPLQFSDEETGVSLNILFNKSASVCMWNQDVSS